MNDCNHITRDISVGLIMVPLKREAKKIFKNILKNTTESWCFTADFCGVIIDIAKESTGSNLRRWYGRDILLFRAQQDIWTGHLCAPRRR